VKKNSLSQSHFGTLPNGEYVTAYSLTNDQGTEVTIITYGGAITSIKTEDSKGEFSDIVLGYDTLEDYIVDSSYFGALIGRYGNRISNAMFSLDGQEITLEKNDGDNNLHGGTEGFNKKNWSATPFEKKGEQGLKLYLLSEDGDQGFPGNLSLEVYYTLTNDNELVIDFKAITDKATPVNLTQHSYFNLASNGSVLEHELEIDADTITPINSALIPTGEFMPVAGTGFDFSVSKTIGQDIDEQLPQLEFAAGYDHNYVLNKKVAGRLSFAARAIEPVSGRILELLTDAPGLQFYSGNFLDGSTRGKGQHHELRSGFCLEPQHFPDSPNQAHFPNTILQPGEHYSTKIKYRFSIKH
jgi:aldose 1-epimerase